jgi:uncharacterized protein DUF6894
MIQSGHSGTLAGNQPEPHDTRRRFDTVHRYHFHIVDGLEVFNSLGAVLADDEAARTRAIELATNIGKNQLADSPIKAIRVTNEQGAILFRVPIRRSG